MMQQTNFKRAARAPIRHRGFSLVEMMVAVAIGLALVTIMLAVYMGSRASTQRQTQLSDIQQGVRTAFEYLATDARGVGHLGCYTRSEKAPKLTGLGTGIADNYVTALEGYNYAFNDEYTLTSTTPADTTTATEWSVIGGAGVITTLPLTTIAGDTGLTPGSDVLVLRSVVGAPLRLTSAAAAGSTFSIENKPANVACGTGAERSGFCQGSHGLIAACNQAQYFTVAAVAGDTLTTSSPLAAPYDLTAEVFPVQTVAYYVRSGSAGTGPSLYRRVFDGNSANEGAAASEGMEQELIEGVESLQVRYGVDTLPLGALDGNVDSYETADAVTDWNHVVAVRMSVLLRSSSPVESSSVVATSAPMNGVTIQFPEDEARKYDRRVFTTTVAIRNRIAYF